MTNTLDTTAISVSPIHRTRSRTLIIWGTSDVVSESMRRRNNSSLNANFPSNLEPRKSPFLQQAAINGLAFAAGGERATAEEPGLLASVSCRPTDTFARLLSVDHSTKIASRWDVTESVNFYVSDSDGPFQL